MKKRPSGIYKEDYLQELYKLFSDDPEEDLETIVYPGRPPWEDDEEVMPNFLRMPLIRKPSKVATDTSSSKDAVESTATKIATENSDNKNDTITNTDTNTDTNKVHAVGCSPYMVGLSVEVSQKEYTAVD